MALALSANGSAGFNHLMATLAATTKLRTVFEFLPSFEDQITKGDMTPHKPLPKGFHLRDEDTTLCEFFLCYLFLFYHHRNWSPIGEVYPFFQNYDIPLHSSFAPHCLSPHGLQSVHIHAQTVFTLALISHRCNAAGQT